MAVTVYGVRHHGAGMALSLKRALEELKPDVVLLEGSPEANDAVGLVLEPGMKPPVALLIYPEADPSSACVYPLAEFSPEWIALRYAAEHDVPARFIDLSQEKALALKSAERIPYEETAENSGVASAEETKTESTSEQPENEVVAEYAASEEDGEENGKLRGEKLARAIISDPIGTMARELGEDPAIWEERVVQTTQTHGEFFALLLKAVTELRLVVQGEHKNQDLVGFRDLFSGLAVPFRDEELEKMRKLARETMKKSGGELSLYEALREASMRSNIRLAKKEGFKRIAVVCGAWHSPAISVDSEDDDVRALVPSEEDDDALLASLNKLPSIKMAWSWIPFAYSRLSFESGYGAGLEAPAWIDDVWQTSLARTNSELFSGADSSENAHCGISASGARFVSRASRLLLEEGFVSSTANAIDAMTTATALAELRDLPAPGLAELRSSILCALCRGETAIYEKIRERLEIGERLGSVPQNAPRVPLMRNFEEECVRCNLTLAESKQNHRLDLRTQIGLQRSRLFRRMNFLNVPWGNQIERNFPISEGQFREEWELAWRPEYAIRIVDSSRYGDTIEDASSAKAREELKEATSLPALTDLVWRALLAVLQPDVQAEICQKLHTIAVQSSDVLDALKALPDLAFSLRYGSRVQMRDNSQLQSIFDVLFARVCNGVDGLCVHLEEGDEEAERVEAFMQLVSILRLMNDPQKFADFMAALENVVSNPDASPLVVGWIMRQLFIEENWDEDELARQFGRYTAPPAEPITVAGCLGGFLLESGRTLQSLAKVWLILDQWLYDLPEDAFVSVLPLIRRAFCTMERREITDLTRVIMNLRNVPDKPKTAAREDSGPTGTLEDQEGVSWDFLKSLAGG